MPDGLMIAVATAVVTAALSTFTTYFAMRAKVRYELWAEYDKDLRERRMKAYETLWPMTEPLARYSPARPLAAQDAGSLSETLRTWYFKNGIVMSEGAREAYFKLQDALTNSGAATVPGSPLDKSVIGELQKASSRMHAALCDDLGSRRPPMIGSSRGS